ncbi:MAG: acyl carrier protein [Bacteroidota bacterium]
MEKAEILKQITEIFKDVLDNENIVLTNQSTANDIEEWDSLAHIHLVVAIERGFKIRFSSKEIQSWDNVGEMVDCILAKGN